MSMRERDGVLLTGVYGVGKSTVAAELAEQLEARSLSYGALDLDWLTWFDTGAMKHDVGERVFLANLAAVVGNYLDVGVKLFVLAGWVGDRADLDRLAAAIPVPLRVVRLAVPVEEIERRLAADPTAARRNDLAHTRQWLADGSGTGFEDLVVDNRGPIDQVAATILDWLGWTDAPHREV
jgi:predicted kinase